MHFKPFNRHIVVDIIEESEGNKDSLIVLPTDYEKPQSPYVKALIIETSEDSKFLNSTLLSPILLWSCASSIMSGRSSPPPFKE